MPDYAFVMPFALDDTTAYILTCKRPFLQKRDKGAPVQGIVPEWAGQWGLVGGQAASGESGPDAATRLFHEQTGLNLSDADVCRNFLLGNMSFLSLETAASEPFTLCCIFTTVGGIRLLESVLHDVKGTVQASNDLIADVAALPVLDVVSRAGSAAEPPGGWSKYLVANYFGGKVPGQFNTEIDTMSRQLRQNSVQKNDFLVTALCAAPN
ncbi:MAG: hypothetical protein EP335_15405 [Alphaproteobacteria bacterium]|nr:MAG: hypothetical protein EP335_15405 [Alphaproteobacteria bacterium]